MNTIDENKLLALRFKCFTDSEFKVLATALTLLDKDNSNLDVMDTIGNLTDQMAYSVDD